MTTFTHPWPESRELWPGLFGRAGLVGLPNLRFLEIGCFEGASTVWLLDHVLTDPSSGIDVIDTFEGNPGWTDWPLEQRDFRQRFLDNIDGYGAKVRVHQGRSADVLRRLTGRYRVVYVDGSHAAPDVLSDAVLSWRLLERGGLMIFDDYRWGERLPKTQSPRIAIDAFAAVYADEVRLVAAGRQYVVERL